ncbi:phospholipase D family protein [Asaia lannensis]|uniref:Phospholipase D n=1 Tax=Asaia lannensis NBRC 102526 TaxID=1307926 RepID=A0ABT1CFG6_9PROT|nr:phospholipase D family protein [Asaia lannensis]MCO6158994.1 phospholipase D family protein [Asaia lannensis NBRC 102526]GBQ96571.1 hypothetical protein AA102526_0839 [Asaia lannensis NBRC 102526]
MVLSNLYANTSATGFTLNFFLNTGKEPKLGLLAAPFFTTNEPILALTSKGCDVRLIVRFSPITTPQALRDAFKNPLVKIRYFTDVKFHTKLYIIDNVALVGSANLTDSGLKANRELSVLLEHGRDEAFSTLPSLFDELWNDADVLNEKVLDEYEKAFNLPSKPTNENAFEQFIQQYIHPANPTSIVVGSKKKSRERNFIQQFRRKYDEILVPAHHEILEVAQHSGFGRPEYIGQDPQIEMGRFLGWLRLTQGGGDGWREISLLRHREARARRISEYVQIWQSAEDIIKGDSYHASREIENISNIRTYLCDQNKLNNLNFDEIFEYLAGCHAFHDRLRFAPRDIGEDLTGIERLRLDFQRKNTREKVVRTIKYLLSGSGDAIERAYDCIYGSYKLEGFGEACVMELLGWGDNKRPPFNNRSIRGIRFLGFDVEHWISGE